MEDMVHRNPGDTSTLTAMEQPFSVARAWVAAEGEPDGGALGGELGGGSTAGTGPSFTRVVIGDLKPDVLRQIMDGEQGGHVCQVRGGRGKGGSWAGVAGWLTCRPAGHDGQQVWILQGLCAVCMTACLGLVSQQSRCMSTQPLDLVSSCMHCTCAADAGAGALVPLLPARRAGQPRRRRRQEGAAAERRALPRHPAALPGVQLWQGRVVRAAHQSAEACKLLGGPQLQQLWPPC